MVSVSPIGNNENNFFFSIGSFKLGSFLATRLNITINLLHGSMYETTFFI